MDADEYGSISLIDHFDLRFDIFRSYDISYLI